MINSSYMMLLKSTEEYQVLNEKEEKEILQLAQSGDKEARDKMILHNLKLVIKIAKRFKDRGIEKEDLIQEGIEGLIVTIERFDINSGFKFSTYAYYWIMQRIYKNIQEKSRMIRVPVYIHEMINHISITKEKLQVNNEEATPERIAAELGIPLRKVKIAMSHMQRSLSLEYESENNEFVNAFSQNTFDEPELLFERKQSNVELRRALLEALDTLSQRYQEVLILRYGLDRKDNKGRTLKEVSDILGITKERVRQIEKKSLKTLKEGRGRTERRRRLREYIQR